VEGLIASQSLKDEPTAQHIYTEVGYFGNRGRDYCEENQPKVDTEFDLRFSVLLFQIQNNLNRR